MDEAHRYYADAGLKAIKDLKPVLGIELTATPKTVGAKPRPFGNVVYHYPLSCALKDGYVKIPAVATRKDFRADQYGQEALETIKLEDGIHHHEYVKVELENYARSQGVKAVKPFMLVVAQDTAHAAAIRTRIESDGFFGGRYRGRVIEVHSNQSGEESDGSQEAREARPEDYLVRRLLDRDEVDYDLYAELLYKLAGQVIAHLRGYLADEEAVENVLLYWQKQLGDFIWAQMGEKQWTTPCDYQGKVIPRLRCAPAGDLHAGCRREAPPFPRTDHRQARHSPDGVRGFPALLLSLSEIRLGGRRVASGPGAGRRRQRAQVVEARAGAVPYRIPERSELRAGFRGGNRDELPDRRAQTRRSDRSEGCAGQGKRRGALVWLC
ncbi:hypothetical protein [Azotobacter armeniacus]